MSCSCICSRFIDLVDDVYHLTLLDISFISTGAYANLASFWATDLGADVVGGCCGVSVTHVKLMADTIHKEYEGRLKQWYATNNKK